PSGSTIASPGSGFGSLTVGAASTAMHERIVREFQFGLEKGAKYRPFSGTQMAFFSSRGPNADGRPDPDIVANGFASFGQGFSAPPTGINFASGTSFSAPTVAGIAAVLREIVPGATARQVRNALILTADPTAIADGSGPNDRGAGFVNAAAAAEMLKADAAPDTPGAVGGTNKNVTANLERFSGIETVSRNVMRSTGPLLPGQRFETFYRVSPNTSAVVVTLADIKPGAVQNQYFGRDDVLLAVHSSKMSAVTDAAGHAGDYRVFEYRTSDKTYVIDNPDNGIMRITVSGDGTNASPISAVIKISSIEDPESGKKTAKNTIADQQTQVVPFVVPFGTQTLSVTADWDGDWGHYPANDLDVILV